MVAVPRGPATISLVAAGSAYGVLGEVANDPQSRHPSRVANKITEVTRRDIRDYRVASEIKWSGKLDEVYFLGRLYDLSSIPSDDYRFKTAKGD